MRTERVAWVNCRCRDSGCPSLTLLKIRFLADPHAAFTQALDVQFDGTAIFGQPRSKRYALVVEDGKVKEAHVEPDNTGVNGELSYPFPCLLC